MIAAQTTVTHRLEVNRVGDVVILAEREADEILAKMGQILQADDDGAGPNDVPCEVEFTRDGAVGALTTTTGSISTEDEFGQLIKLPGDVKIVDFIEWCYSSEDQYHLLGMHRRYDVCRGQWSAVCVGRGRVGS